MLPTPQPLPTFVSRGSDGQPAPKGFRPQRPANPWRRTRASLRQAGIRTGSSRRVQPREQLVEKLVQSGRFTLHSYHTPIEQLPKCTGWLRKFIVPKEHKQKLLHQLAAMGISRSNLFPDLPNLAAELRATRFEL